jgi:hypothetical protein
MKQYLIATGFAGLLAVAVGCSDSGGGPTSPTTPAVGDTGAAAGDSSLKATAPELRWPTGGVRTDSTHPGLVIRRSQGQFADGNFEYRFELSTPGGQVVHTSDWVQSDGDEIIYFGLPELSLDTRYRWRARAEMASSQGPWSDYAEFVTIDYRGIVPRPPNGEWPRTGPAVVAYIASVFPEQLRPVPSDDERIVIMEWLRDRIIEAGICGGLDLARNLKRGVGPHSIDALAWRQPDGDVEVIDLAVGYDENENHLELHWLEVPGPPGYDPLPNHPGC